MRLAKVVTINDNIDVIIKKALDKKGKHTISLNYIGRREDGALLNITFMMKGEVSEKVRDYNFDNIDTPSLVFVISDLEQFKPLLDEKN